MNKHKEESILVIYLMLTPFFFFLIRVFILYILNEKHNFFIESQRCGWQFQNMRNKHAW